MRRLQRHCLCSGPGVLTRTYSATLDGINGSVIEIEAVSLNSLPLIHITGLPGEVVKESRDRVAACLVNLGYDIPTSKVLVHLSPATTKKLGSHYDLAIALSVLAAEGRLGECKLRRFGFVGELALDGRIQPVNGALALIEALERRTDIETVIIPTENNCEAALISSGKVKLASHIGEVMDWLHGRVSLPGSSDKNESSVKEVEPLLDRVVGQQLAKRALQIALAGRHPLLFWGPPGVGKSLISSCSPSLVPAMTKAEFVETMKVYSASNISLENFDLSQNRPFRAPHHSISANALLGGGTKTLVPGEVSLAHNGILFVDEFPEFRRDAIEGLREPLQSGILHLHRVGKALSLPARFTFIAAMNPCPCGLSGQGGEPCQCSPEKRRAYQKKLSSPILDRIALMVSLSRNRVEPTFSDALRHNAVRESIERVFFVQRARYGNQSQTLLNGDIEIPGEWDDFKLEGTAKTWFENLCLTTCMSFRKSASLIKVARTISDLNGDRSINVEALSEAWSLRCFDTYQVH